MNEEILYFVAIVYWSALKTVQNSV